MATESDNANDGGFGVAQQIRETGVAAVIDFENHNLEDALDCARRMGIAQLVFIDSQGQQVPYDVEK